MIFTEDEVASLNEFQEHGNFHPFTCGICRKDLKATTEGWICPDVTCTYTQNWAHEWMKNWEWKKFEMPYFDKKGEK